MTESSSCPEAKSSKKERPLNFSDAQKAPSEHYARRVANSTSYNTSLTKLKSRVDHLRSI